MSHESNGRQQPPVPPHSQNRISNVVDDRIQKAADLLKQKWLEVEAKLRELIKLPRHVWVSYHSEPEDPSRPDEYEFHQCLGIARFRGDWRLCRGTFSESTNESGPSNWKPIVECSIEERVQAASCIPKLRERIVKSTETFLPQVDDAIQKLTQALSQF